MLADCLSKGVKIMQTNKNIYCENCVYFAKDGAHFPNGEKRDYCKKMKHFIREDDWLECGRKQRGK